MSMIPVETIEQVRDNADIVGLIGESVALKRTGSDYRAPCPFHGGHGGHFRFVARHAAKVDLEGRRRGRRGRRRRADGRTGGQRRGAHCIRLDHHS